MADIAERARELQASINQQMKTPAAILLPAPVRECIRQLAAIVAELAERKV